MSLGRTLILKTAALKPVESIVRKSFLFKPMVTRFIAGDSLEDALKESETILPGGQRISLDYLGENTHSENEALAACKIYADMLDRIDRVSAVQTWKADQVGTEPLNISIKQKGSCQGR
jgi:proline dehydrogenase